MVDVAEPRTASSVCRIVTSTKERTSISILLVDDDQAFQYLCVRALERDEETNYRIVAASSCDEAFSLFDPNTIDCALVDYQLPDGTGCELMKRLHGTYPDWFGPVVIITSGGSEEIAAQVMRSGAADYIPKQLITPTSVQRVMTNSLEKARLRKAIHEHNTALESTNAELSKRNDEISRFYHRVSHEIKTPLTAARMFMSMLHAGLAGEISERQRDIIGQAMESCDELAAHFDDLVECTRLDARKLSLNRKQTSLQPVVRRAILSVSNISSGKKLQITNSVASDVPDLPIDAGRIVQVVANLVGNAVKFTQPGGRVAVDVALSRHKPGFVEIRVSDSGQGMDKEHLPRIFDRLYQVGEVGDAQIGAGLGLGLTIAAEIVKLHGGAIDVTSELGEGSRFTVYLPLHPSDYHPQDEDLS